MLTALGKSGQADVPWRNYPFLARHPDNPGPETPLAMKTNFPPPWNTQAENFPRDGTLAEKWEFVVRYASMAPSSHNTQPWQFRVRQDVLELHADRSRACPVVDPTDRELVISCGCALFHLKTALRHFNALGRIDILPEPNPNLLARIHWGSEGESLPHQRALFDAIPLRRTNRQPFHDQSIPPAFIPVLKTAAASESALLQVLSDEQSRVDLAILIAAADRTQWSNPAFRLELSHWVHATHSQRLDGIPGYATGVDDFLSGAGPVVVRTFDLGDGEAAHDEELALGSPALAILSSAQDTPRHWIATGQALASVLLHARVEGIWASYLNQPIEIPELRAHLARQLNIIGWPQIILRLGYADAVQPTPRRPTDELWIP